MLACVIYSYVEYNGWIVLFFIRLCLFVSVGS